MLTEQYYAYVECLHLSFVSQLFYFFLFLDDDMNLADDLGSQG